MRTQWFSRQNLVVLFVLLSTTISIRWLVTCDGADEAWISLFTQFVTLIVVLDKRS